MSDAFRLASRETVLTCFAFAVERRIVTSDRGETFERDVVVHPGAVVILPVRADGSVGLLRQYRATFDDVNWELPAGTRDVAGEPPETTARRELREEMGCDAANVRELFRFMNSRGWTDQSTIIYEATDLTFVPSEPSGPEESAAEIHWLDHDQLAALVDAGELIEAATLIALLWYLRRSP